MRAVMPKAPLPKFSSPTAIHPLKTSCPTVLPVTTMEKQEAASAAGERSSPRQRKPPTIFNAPDFKVKKTVPRVTPRNDKPRKTKTVQKEVQKAAALDKPRKTKTVQKKVQKAAALTKKAAAKTGGKV